MSQAKLISEYFVRPKIEVDKSKKLHPLGPFELMLLLLNDIQVGSLYQKPTNFSTFSYLETLGFSLSEALVHFYPLAGRLVTVRNEAEHSSTIYVDCTKGPGARLIHASAQDLTMMHVLNQNSDVSKVVRSFFDLGETIINHDGHTRPLLTVQLTELQDGLFLGFCFNHSVVDGISVYHFLRVWSNIHMESFSSSIPLPQVKQPSFLDGRDFKLPFLDANEFVIRSLIDPQLRETIFQFSPRSLEKLKAMANSDANKISSFLAMSAFVWKCITRVRNLPSDELTTCALPVNLRPRFKPCLTDDYFGGYTIKARGCAKVDDLLGNSLGWAATLLQQAVGGLDEKAAQTLVVRALDKGPEIAPPFQICHSGEVIVGGSPRFDVNEIKFGLGEVVGFRGGYGNKMDGKVNAYLGSEGDGSVDVEICLAPDTMTALLCDQQFMCFASLHNGHLKLNSII